MPKHTAPEMEFIPYNRRPKAETPLWKWLRQEKVPNYQFARLIRASEVALSRWCYNWTLPPLVYAFRIEQATKGAVPVAAWLGTELGKLEWERMGHNFAKEREARNGRRRRVTEKKAKLKELADTLGVPVELTRPLKDADQYKNATRI